jgi:uncharacterized PurR-regulated membrane protein YhhQ (DUF165 family)
MTNRYAQVGLVITYLAAIVAANLIITKYGPSATLYVAFGLIALDLTTRDALHDAWGKWKLPKMAALIAAGSILSYVVSDDAGKIALASAVAFGTAATVDGVVYQLRHQAQWLERANLSNLFGAAADTLVFFAIAFGLGNVPFLIVFGQFAAKVAGGLVWSLLLSPWKSRREAVAQA